MSKRSHKAVIRRIILGLIVALAAMTTQAQGSWAAWIYSPSDGSVVRVSAKGEIIDAYSLPLNPAFNAYGQSALVSPSGRFVAYTTVDTITGQGNQQLFVYDTQAGIIRFAYDLTGVDGDMLSFNQLPHSAAFDESAQTLAFGAVRNGEWELVVANLATESLSGGAPLTAADSGLQGGNLLPVPEQVRGNAVRFFLLPIGTNYLREYPAYRWTPGQAVDEIGESSAFSAVRPGTGEIAMPVHDIALTNAVTDIAGPVLAYNTIYIAGPAGRDIAIHDSAIEISQVWWIGGGDQLLVQGFDAALNGDVLKVYRRDGSLIGQFSGGLRDIRGTNDGFVGLFPSGGGVGLAHVTTDGGAFAPSTIWTTADPAARLIHVQQ